MNKLLLIITLFVSSFFIFHEDAKAFELNIEFDNFDYIGETFLLVKQACDERINDSSYSFTDYIIYLNGSTYYVVFFTSSPSLDSYCNPKSYVSTYDLSCTFIEGSTYKYTTILKTVGSANPFILPAYLSSSNPPYGKYPLFSTFDFTYINNQTEDISINLKYTDFSIKINSGEKLPSMYDFYNLYQNPVEENPHKEELEKVESFYKVIIEKISYLAEALVSNYIYLSIIVIFILIFVFLLIFRRHL